MAKISKFYRITNQIMVEYIQNHYPSNTTSDAEQNVQYYVYTGKDDNVYYSEIPDETEKIDYSNPQYFLKLPDVTDSEYLFFGFSKNENEKYTNQKFIQSYLENPKYVKSYTKVTNSEVAMAYDRIRLHFIYGFTLNGLAGVSVQLKTKARYLGPIQNIIAYNQPETDNQGNPVFKKIKDINGNELEILAYNQTDFILLDYFFPKECMNFDDVIHYHKSPIYQNGSYYDRYIEIKVPSAYYMSLEGAAIPLTIKNPYGIGTKTDSHGTYVLTGEYRPSNDGYVHYEIDGKIYKFPMFTDQNYIQMYNEGRYRYLPQYGLTSLSQERQFTYVITQDPKLEVNFATVQEDRLKSVFTLSQDNEVNVENYFGAGARMDIINYRSVFLQDPINTIAMSYNSNSDYFNAVIFEDPDNLEVVYYPTYGETKGDNNENNAPPLNYEVMSEIETGAIPMLTEGFYDGLENIDEFVETYGQNAFKWIIFNDLSVTFGYGEQTSSTTATSTIIKTVNQHFTNIIDYTLYQDAKYEFYKGHYVPRPSSNLLDETGTKNLVCKSIIISYTCRLVNRLTNVEAIRNATLVIKDPKIYEAQKVTLKNVVTYKIFNKTTKDVVNPRTIIKESNDRYIRSYYDATNLVVKDMGTNAIYTQGQMTLYLKRSSSNYMFRLFTLNSDNVRVPYDLTGPFRYVLSFPALDGSKIKIIPNKDSEDVKLGVGQLVFYITEQQVRRIMAVPDSERYFAITTDTDNNDSQISTLYEGKVEYFTT